MTWVFVLVPGCILAEVDTIHLLLAQRPGIRGDEL